MALTAEQLAKIEQNRQAALRKRAERAQVPQTSNNTVPRLSSNIRPPQATMPVALPLSTLPLQSHQVTRPTSSTVFRPPPSATNQVSSNNSNVNYSNNNNNYNRTNLNTNFNQNNSKGMAKKLPYHNKYSQGFYVTPNKRPSDDQPAGEKRQNTQVKSPYEQVMEKAVPLVQVDFRLLNNREFVLDFKFSSKLIEKIKAFPGNPRFDAKNKCWVFKLEFYKEICEKLNAINSDQLKLQIGPGIPQKVIDILKDSLKYNEIKVNLEDQIPRSVIEQLFPYQREGIKFGVKREGRCLLADDCGLGKTMQAIGIALYYFDDWPLLIVCPASVKFQWRDALLKWVPQLQPEDIKEIDSKKSDPHESSTKMIVISSYDSVHKVEQIMPKEPKCAILDECHMVKDSKTKRYKLISKLVNKAKRLILISGTPAMSRPSELFTQLKLLMPKVFSNKENFINRYCDPQMTMWGKKAGGCTNAAELKVILLSTVMVRRMKDDVLNELPPKRRVKINLDCHLTGKDKSEIEKFISRFKGPQQIDDENESFSIAFSRTAEVKLEPIKNYLEFVMEKEIKFLFFAHHRTMMDGICDFLNSKKIRFIKIDGSVPPHERAKCCDHFQNNDTCRAAVLSITAAGVGLNLTAAQLVIFGELYFNPGALIQAEDRVHRIGQKDSVLIEYLLAPGTIDDHIWQMVHKKVETLDSLGIKNDGFEFKKDSKN